MHISFDPPSSESYKLKIEKTGKKSSFNDNCHEKKETQIVFALRQSENGVSVQEIFRKMGISEATFYNWKKRILKLKQIVADLTPDKQMLQDVLKKSSKAGSTEGNWCNT